MGRIPSEDRMAFSQRIGRSKMDEFYGDAKDSLDLDQCQVTKNCRHPPQSLRMGRMALTEIEGHRCLIP